MSKTLTLKGPAFNMSKTVGVDIATISKAQLDKKERLINVGLRVMAVRKKPEQVD